MGGRSVPTSALSRMRDRASPSDRSRARYYRGRLSFTQSEPEPEPGPPVGTFVAAHGQLPMAIVTQHAMALRGHSNVGTESVSRAVFRKSRRPGLVTHVKMPG